MWWGRTTKPVGELDDRVVPSSDILFSHFGRSGGYRNSILSGPLQRILLMSINVSPCQPRGLCTHDSKLIPEGIVAVGGTGAVNMKLSKERKLKDSQTNT